MVSIPNHCLNVMTVTGASSELATFINHGLIKEDTNPENTIITSCPDLHYLYPIPNSVNKAEDPKILSKTEWNWRTENWGTKWNTYENNGAYVLRSETSNRLLALQVEFETAWGPPLGAIQIGSTKFPNLVFTCEYAEPGMMFKGFAVYSDGIVEIDHIEMNISDDELESEKYTKLSDEVWVDYIADLKAKINLETTMSITYFGEDII